MSDAANAPGTPPAGAPAAGTSDWRASFDDDARGVIELKGWQDQNAIVRSYRDLEKLTRGTPAERLAAIPDKADDAEGWNALYSKLGRPESADKYEIPMPSEGGSEEFAKWARGTFHELGLSAAQARSLVEKWNEFATSTMGAEAEAGKRAYEEEQTALKKEWGSSFDKNLAAVKRAATQLGLTAETLDALENTVGYSTLMRHLQTVGVKLGEDAFVNGDGGRAGFAMTPGAARAKIAELKSDQNFRDRLVKGDVKAKAEWEGLHKVAYEEGA